MYHIVAAFDVLPEQHAEFIAAALKNGRDSRANEPGTRRFELIKDPACANRFYLNEAYDDQAAFHAHEHGPYFKEFFAVTGAFAKGYAPITGTSPTDTGTAVEGVPTVVRFKQLCEQWLQTDAFDELAAEDRHHYIGSVRRRNIAPTIGVSGVTLLAVHFETCARTRPHVHPTEQLLYFVRGNGFVAFLGQEEQLAVEGDILIIPACEVHMHGATDAGPTCHVAAMLPSTTNWKPRVPAEWRRFTEAR